MDKLAQYAVRVWGAEMNFEDPRETALEGVRRLSALIREAGLPTTLHEAGIGAERFEEMADNLTANGTTTCGAFCRMTKQDILELLHSMA